VNLAASQKKRKFDEDFKFCIGVDGIRQFFGVILKDV
jgi:hypothetical protein